jgi:uncharacterized repeat protein (TIGR01451 family)
MTDTTSGRRARSWVALVAGALAAMAALLLALGGGVAGAQDARSVDLDVTKTVHPKTVHVGERQTFTIKVTNDGSTRAERVRMRDPLPSKVRFIRASTSRHVPGSCGIEDRVVTCHLGTLRPDRTVTVKIYVKPVVAGSYTNRAYVSFTNSGARDASDASVASDAVEAAAVPRGE